MTEREDHTQYNVRFPDELLEQLKQHQVYETTRRNKLVTLHELIIEAVKTMIER
jgi:hypothetical protein